MAFLAGVFVPHPGNVYPDIRDQRAEGVQVFLLSAVAFDSRFTAKAPFMGMAELVEFAALCDLFLMQETVMGWQEFFTPRR